ncbi:hypothetical protein HYT02_05535 [Candidatus Gottesmanbacteria bacterium]|nr:hypothetical protein [Candidatus Gottesmanbacteria bacterium]
MKIGIRSQNDKLSKVIPKTQKAYIDYLGSSVNLPAGKAGRKGVRNMVTVLKFDDSNHQTI